MGVVYLAEDTTLDRQVALKVLPPSLAQDTERRARFTREAKAVAALNHPNIVSVHSVEEEGGVLFITMEFVKGKTLAEILPRQGLALDKFFDIGIPLADALAAMHAHGITHRDLKPANVMVSADGRVKVLDFGLAKAEPESSVRGGTALPTHSVTQEGRVVGTPSYMSPERAEGKTVDTRSDIFSLGIVFYEMLTGERPFTGGTAASIVSSVLRDTPRSIGELQPGLPRELVRLVHRCLAKDPIDRYQSALDLRHSLEETKQDVDSGDALPSHPTSNRSSRSIRMPLGGEQKLLARIGEQAYSLRFSADDQSLYYCVITGPRDKHGFWKLSLASGDISRLTKLEGRRGSIGYDFAIDGRYLYFTWREDEGDIWVMDVATDVRK
jgi:eukaryotic-like serine/threonine-protein kinase